MAAVAGPGRAYELSGRRISATVLTGTTAAELRRLRRIFDCDYYRVWRSTDPVGVEVFAALRVLHDRNRMRRVGCWRRQADPMRSTWPCTTPRRCSLRRPRGAIADRSIVGGQARDSSGCRVRGDLYNTSTGGRTFRLGWRLGTG